MSTAAKHDDNSLGRRSFLKNSAAAGAGFAAGMSVSEQENTAYAATNNANDHPYNPRTHKVMPTRNLGKTGYQVGIYSLGGQATLEKEGTEKESVDIINRAIDLGVNYIDTAAAYGRGISETHIGKVIKHRRNEVFLATKTNKFTYDESMRLLDKSLKQLQTDHLDTWQLHNIKTMEQLDTCFAKDGALKALEKARDEGIIRFLGITGHYEPLVLAEGIRRYDFDTILMAINAADSHYLSFKRYLLPIAQKKNMGIIAMKLASRGRLISEWSPPPLEQQREYMRTPKPGTISMKDSLYYNFTLPVSTSIVGIDNVAQIEQNMKWASEFSPLNEEQMAEIEYKTLPIVRQSLYFRRWDMGV